MIELKMTRAEAIRLQKGMLYREVADGMGTSRINVNRKLNGHGGMRKSNLAKLAEVLGYGGNPDELLETVTLREVAL